MDLRQCRQSQTSKGLFQLCLGFSLDLAWPGAGSGLHPIGHGQEHKGLAQSTAGQVPLRSSSRICWFRSESHSGPLTQSP